MDVLYSHAQLETINMVRKCPGEIRKDLIVGNTSKLIHYLCEQKKQFNPYKSVAMSL